AAQEKARVELSSNSALALEWAQKAVAAEKGNFTGRRLNLLGRIQVAQGDLTAADDTLKKALDANRSNELREEEANSLRMLGIVARKQHRFVDAERLLTEALELDKLLGVSVKIGTDLEELALTARDAGKPEKAADYLGRACDVHLNGGRPGQAGADMTALADLYGQLGDSRKAEAARRRAREITAGQTSQKPGRSVETTNPSSSP
ncbi:MAG TPA: tetratricopeptide repeat protein, partial [Desulfuromonadaceae bacterium]